VFEYRKHGRYFAQCARGVEGLLAGELRALGVVRPRESVRGVGFQADRDTLYGVVLRSRLAVRVLAPLLTFDCHSDRYLYATARKLDWDAILSPERTFAVVANVSHSRITHSRFAAQRLKDAVVDHFRDACGRRPSVDRRSPDVWLNLHINHNRAAIALDVSGGSLHRRGYRLASVAAPLQETLAAAVLCLSGWDGESPLVDFMCGSGTLLAEAWLQASRLPPGWRDAEVSPPPACLPDFDAAAWRSVLAAARDEHRRPPAGLVSGSDADPAAVRAALANLSALPGGEAVRVDRADFRDVEVSAGTTIVVNPPYGVRLEERSRVEALYADLGDHLKRGCRGATAWVLCGDVELVKRVGLRPSRRIPLWNGGLECRLVQYDLY
jgi:putative N6-adenine-specific DNA methylase